MTFSRSLILLFVLLGISHSASFAQFQIGASYEMRNYTPGQGFGVQVDSRSVFVEGLFDVRYRASISSYSEDREVLVGTEFIPEQLAPQSLSIFNINMGALIEFPLPFLELRPYTGLTFGVENYSSSIRLDVNDPDIPRRQFTDDESAVEFSGIVGLRSIIASRISPFAEFRFSTFSNTTYIPNPQQRVVVGLSLQF